MNDYMYDLGGADGDGEKRGEEEETSVAEEESGRGLIEKIKDGGARC